MPGWQSTDTGPAGLRPFANCSQLAAAVSSGEVARAAFKHPTVCLEHSSLAQAATRFGCGLLACKPSCSELRLPARCLHAAMRAALHNQMTCAPQAVWGTAGTRREAHAHAGVAGAEDWACRARRAGETAVPVSSSAARLCLLERQKSVQPCVQPENPPSHYSAGRMQHVTCSPGSRCSLWPYQASKHLSCGQVRVSCEVLCHGKRVAPCSRALNMLSRTAAQLERLTLLACAHCRTGSPLW